MSITLRSFAKINLGLKIGPARVDGFHELRTIYQTIALHDLVTVDVQEGSGIEIRCTDERVPLDESNTCYKIAERVIKALPRGLKPGSRNTFFGTAEAVPFQVQHRGAEPSGERVEPQIPRLAALARDDKPGELTHGTAEAVPFQSQVGNRSDQSMAENANSRGRIVITIAKRLPVQGGMGAASSNGVATMLGLERALGVQLAPAERQRIAAEVGSDLPLFLVGGTVLGAGRGEEVHALPDLAVMHLVAVTPPFGVSTPRAFARWDEYAAGQRSPAAPKDSGVAALTDSRATGTINEFSQSVLDWLSKSSYPQVVPASGVPATGSPPSPAFGFGGVKVGGDRAETPLLDLVRAGIENDFERVVFSEYPDLCEVKRVLQREGARYASLSGSGATLYGVFATAEEAEAAAARMRAAGHAAVATRSLTRDEYWEQLWQ
jgi:4-diphosphocytidyl-2-C-methyl-D-erythritol kinase